MIDVSVLRENDIRGVYGKNITEVLALKVGKAFGTYLTECNKTDCVVGYDNRISGEILVEYVVKGLMSTGINVKFVGLVTTPILNYATYNLNIEAGIMVTASHNPANENGFKIFGENFLHLKRNELERVYELIKGDEYEIGIGNVEYYDVIDKYIDMLDTYINIGDKRLKVAFDTGNGTTSLFIRKIIEKFNVEPIFINEKSDGTFPNHNPDPNNDNNLVTLKELVVKEKCDLGVAYDGDGDRVGIVDELGHTIETDKLVAIFSRYIIPKSLNKKVLFDVKSSKALEEDVIKIGGEPIMLKNGSAYLETIMFERDILIGGEYSGHIFFRDKYYGFDDGIYASLRMIEILSNQVKKCSELLNGYNKYFNTPEIRLIVGDNKKWNILNDVKKYVSSNNYEYIDIDGVRINFSDGWALVRCSNTSPEITMRFEAITEDRLKIIQEEFTNLVNSLM